MANLRAVLQRPKVAETYSRNPFDRSESVNFSYQLGGLDVFFAEQFIAGSHVKLNRSIFQRTADVNTAAFPKIDTHVEFFAVPIRLLWMHWNNFKLNIQDFGSTYQGTVGSGYNFTPTSLGMPWFDIHQLLKDINMLYDSSYDANTPYNSAYFGSLYDGGINAPRAIGAKRLLGGLGYGMYPNLAYTDSDTSKFAVNPLKALAYQKVYYDHFRNTAYESNNPIYYNVDDLVSSSEMDKIRTANMLTYRYVNYRKDYMQSIYPALNYTVSAPNGLQWLIPDTVMYNSNSSSNGGQYIGHLSSAGGQTSIYLGPGSSASYPNNITVQSIRASFALDKLLRASAYAPKHVKDQFEARYGVKGVEAGNESVRIGAFMNDIVIQEVVNTAANLGEIGGKGVGYSGFGKDIEYTCKEDCIILGLVYSLPRSSYDATFVRNWNAKIDREDFFIPEFMDLGMQPFNQYENTFMNSVGGSIVPYWTGVNGAIAYKDRYSEYKIGIDRNLGNFIKGNSLSDFVTHSNQDLNSFNYGGANANYFKVKPTDLDSVFVQATKPDKMGTDKFITHIDVKCICNQNMSVHGQPRIGSIG